MNPEFVLNEPRYKGAQILLARDNFGCGSSREHAAWALADYGFRALIAPSFADIFYGNCLKNGVLPIILDKPTVEELFEAVRNTPGYQVSVDLDAQTVTLPEGHVASFAIEPSRKTYLLDGLDDIAITLQQVELIRSYERQRQLLHQQPAFKHGRRSACQSRAQSLDG